MMTRTLKPGMLVSLKTSIKGGVDYRRTDIEADHEGLNGERVARWETTRRIEDPAEHERAVTVRGKARSLISGVCVASDFGLLCPETKIAELTAAIGEAEKLAAEFNAGASLAQIGIYTIMGRIETDDVRAQRAINAEIRDLLDGMSKGIATADPAAIREAANTARRLGGMLSEDAAGKVNAAIEEARAAAREIVKRVEKSGEVAATVIGEIKTEALASARFAFLDLDGGTAAEPIAATGHALDLAPETPETVAPGPTRAIEFDAPAPSNTSPAPVPMFEVA